MEAVGKRQALRWVALVLLVAGAAQAAPRKGPTRAAIEEAQSRYQHARELYEENDFQAALVEFQRAYELAPSYRLLYNIAQVYYQLQDYAGALRSFQQYLDEGQGEVPAQRREEVQRELERLQGRVGSLRILSTPGAELQVDDVPVGTAPLAEPVLVSAGRHRITATLAGHAPGAKVVTVAGRDSLTVSVELVPLSSAGGRPLASSEPASSTPSVTRDATPAPALDIPRWVPWAATGTLAAATLTTGVLTLGASQELQRLRDTFGVTPAQLQEASGSARTLALTTDVLAAATVIAAGFSVVTLLSSPPTPDSTASVQVGVAPGGIAVAGSF